MAGLGSRSPDVDGSMMDHLGFISVNRREVIGIVKHVTQHYVSVVSE
jgi:hypothetical protein